METEETKTVKVWETDSTHPNFEKANARRESLVETLGKEAVKIRNRGRGFMVKVWRGETRAAPKRKAPPAVKTAVKDYVVTA